MSDDRYRAGRREPGRENRRGDDRRGRNVEEEVKERLQGEEVLIPAGPQGGGGQTGGGQQPPQGSRHNLEYGGESRHEQSHARRPQGQQAVDRQQQGRQPRDAGTQQGRPQGQQSQQVPQGSAENYAYGGESRHDQGHRRQPDVNRQQFAQQGTGSQGQYGPQEEYGRQNQYGQQGQSGQQESQQQGRQTQPSPQQQHVSEQRASSRQPNQYGQQGQSGQQRQQDQSRRSSGSRYTSGRSRGGSAGSQFSPEQSRTEQSRLEGSHSGEVRPGQSQQYQQAGQPTPSKQPHQQPTEDRSYSRRLEQSRQTTEGRTDYEQSAGRFQSEPTPQDSFRQSERREQGRSGGVERAGPSGFQTGQTSQTGRGSPEYGERQSRGRGQQSRQNAESRSRDVGTQQPDFGMSQQEQRRAPDVGTRRSQGGEIDDNAMYPSDRPGQFEGREENIHSEGSRHDNQY
ncbi:MULTISPECIES: hypothetical protein [Halorussus]|uniref:hypothetical protein n=1 Tax=Halorussus TaxID=1070314 RepID=UPI00209E9F67|nr:hypothetical protein [Halorussus vallis]USZ76693.1 hypothetical protein NGM07_05030 [Halorussus vallis]